MNLIATIILGIVQGISEFLPISSSAHLIIFRDVFGIGKGMLSLAGETTFDLALHLGTLLAIGIYFFKDFIKMFQKGFTTGIKEKEGKLLWLIVTATIPAAIVGVLLEDVVDNVVRNKYILISLALIVMGIILYKSDKLSESTKKIDDITFKDALIIGCAQMFALIPGFSRSGTTISAARTLKLDRTSATKFSFYMSAPVILGGAILKLLHKSTWTLISTNYTIFVIGIISSFIIGLLCINFLLKYIKNNDFKVFMYYRILIALVVIITVLVKMYV